MVTILVNIGRNIVVWWIMIFRLFVVCLCFTLASCATVFSDSSDVINFTSVPPGAVVLVNNKEIGKTPLSQKFDRDTFAKSYVTVRFEGHQDQKFLLKKQLNKVSLINFTFWPSWATDALSGSMIQYSPNNYHVFLKPQQLAQKQEQDFILKNYRSLLNDIARGDGEYLNSLWKMSFRNKMSYHEFLKRVRAKTPELLNAKRAPTLSQVLMQIKP